MLFHLIYIANLCPPNRKLLGNLISQQNGVNAAYFGFLDRFRALPGDYNEAASMSTPTNAYARCGLPFQFAIHSNILYR